MLNRAQYPSDVIALVVLWRLRYKLALRDLPEMFWSAVSCSAMRPCASGKPSSLPPWRKTSGAGVAARRAAAGTSMKPTSRSTAAGAICRAIDRSGALVDVMFSERRDMAADPALIPLVQREIAYREVGAFRRAALRPTLAAAQTIGLGDHERILRRKIASVASALPKYPTPSPGPKERTPSHYAILLN